ncbi:unnamed protein product [Moneuplotes crassus]|uniref:Uncharacterized protein n=1 Tax=Euplotes crassus TaxID=5936 RepID=A0AAD1U0Q7_EUPCR|nr:unnamed protein product [Moneuplotes crassus]
MEQSVTLLKTEEARLDQLYHSRCDEDQRMDFTQFLLFVLDRSIISNKFGLEVFYQAFKEAAQDGDYLDIKSFNYAIVWLSKIIFADEYNPVETMFTTVLMDKTITHQKDLVGGRVPSTDKDTLAVLSEEAVLFYIAYMDRLKILFASCHHNNSMESKRRVNWKELSDKNMGILAGSFLNFCKDYFLIPHMFNVEVLEGILFSILTPLHVEESEYFTDHKLVGQCEGDKKKISSSYEFISGEPEILLHEFLFIIGKIAYKTVIASEAETLEDKLKVFFFEKLKFPSIENPIEYAVQLLSGEIDPEEDLYSSDEDLESEQLDDPQQKLLEFIERRTQQDENFVLDYEEVLQELELSLPPLPEKPKVVQENPPPYIQPRILFGKHLPKPEEDDKDKKKKPQPRRQNNRKKDEKPKKIYPFEEYPPKPREPDNLYHFDNLRNEMNENIFPTHYNALQCNPGVGPCIIKEVLFPPEAPQEFATLIESALVYQNTANYDMALETFERCRDEWRKAESGDDWKKNEQEIKPLRPEIELFFELSLGSVYESAGRDELALSKYLSAKNIKLVYNHPDQAFPYCGIGSILFHMEEPVWALRAYLKAREIREERLGGDTVDTATVYNNLGCCMLTIERNQEACAFFELAEAILEVELGSQHERTLTAARNVKKAKRTVLNIKPEYPPLWSFAALNPNPKLTKKKKKKGKKKKK